MGKTKATITLTALENLASKGINQAELARIYGLSDARISQILSDPECPERLAWDRGRGNLHKSLKEKQLELALAGNTLMLIWLSKQYLGFADKHEDTSEVNVNVNVRYIAKWGASSNEELPAPPSDSYNQDLSGPDDPDIIDSTATDADDLPDPPAPSD